MSGFGIDHVHIFSEKVDETVQFYKTMFGASELRKVETEISKLVHLDLGGTRIVVSNALAATPAGLGHFAIYTDDLAAVVARLKEQNYEVTEMKQTGKYTNCFLKDAFGVIIELVTPSTV